MNVRRVIGVIVGILVLFFIISQPRTAAGLVLEVVGLLEAAGSAILTFLTSLL